MPGVGGPLPSQLDQLLAHGRSRPFFLSLFGYRMDRPFGPDTTGPVLRVSFLLSVLIFLSHHFGARGHFRYRQNSLVGQLGGRKRQRQCRAKLRAWPRRIHRLEAWSAWLLVRQICVLAIGSQYLFGWSCHRSLRSAHSRPPLSKVARRGGPIERISRRIWPSHLPGPPANAKLR